MSFDYLRCLLWKEKEKKEFEPVLCVGVARMATASISDSIGCCVIESDPIKAPV